jgi:hypothetical protein
MGGGCGSVIWPCYNTGAKTNAVFSLSFILNKTNIINHTTGIEYHNSYVVKFSVFQSHKFYLFIPGMTAELNSPISSRG